jgi:VCBS repeat-containing protein
VVLGDTGQVDWNRTTGALVRIQSSGSADALNADDSIALPGNGFNYVIGGAGRDTLTGGLRPDGDTPDLAMSGMGSVSDPGRPGQIVSVTRLGLADEFGALWTAYEATVPDGGGSGGGTGGGTGGGEIGSLTGEGAVDEGATTAARGKLTLPAQAGGAAAFERATFEGLFGSLALEPDGSWTYTLDAARVASLKADETRSEVFMPRSLDGTRTTVTIAVAGADTVIGGKLAGTVALAAAAPADSGRATIADGEQLFEPAEIAGTYGRFAIVADGAWTYTADAASAAARALRDGGSASDSFAIRAKDGTRKDVVITVTGTNDVPVLSVDAARGQSAAASVAEGSAGIGPVVDGSIGVADPDTGDALTVTVPGVSIARVPATVALALPDTQTLLGFFSARLDTGSGTIGWSFAAGTVDFDGLRAGERIDLVYTIDVADIAGATATREVVVSVEGRNDAPVLSRRAGDADGVQLAAGAAEPLTAAGTLSLADADLGDVPGVAILGDPVATGVVGGLPDLAALRAMFTLGAVTPDPNVGARVAWRFDAEAHRFADLKAGESVTLSYTLRATDAAGAVSDRVVSVVVTGRNDAPALVAGVGNADRATLDAAPGALTASGTLGVVDPDAGDAVSAAVVSVAATGDRERVGLTDAQIAALLQVEGGRAAGTGSADGVVTWRFAAPGDAFAAMRAGDRATLVYTLRATDAAGESADRTVTIVVEGANDAPRLAIAGADQSLSGTRGIAWNYTLPAGMFADPDDGTLTYAATLASGAEMPGWMRFDPVARSFSGTPPAGSAALALRVVASDAAGASAAMDFVLRLAIAPDLPPAPVAAGSVNVAGTGTVPASADAAGRGGAPERSAPAAVTDTETRTAMDTGSGQTSSPLGGSNGGSNGGGGSLGGTPGGDAATPTQGAPVVTDLTLGGRIFASTGILAATASMTLPSGTPGQAMNAGMLPSMRELDRVASPPSETAAAGGTPSAAIETSARTSMASLTPRSPALRPADPAATPFDAAADVAQVATDAVPAPGADAPAGMSPEAAAPLPAAGNAAMPGPDAAPAAAAEAARRELGFGEAGIVLGLAGTAGLSGLTRPGPGRIRWHSAAPSPGGIEPVALDLSTAPDRAATRSARKVVWR